MTHAHNTHARYTLTPHTHDTHTRPKHTARTQKTHTHTPHTHTHGDWVFVTAHTFVSHAALCVSHTNIHSSQLVTLAILQWDVWGAEGGGAIMAMM